MPLFPELRPHLQAVLDELLADFDPKANRLSEQPVISRYRDTNANLRTQMLRIIKRAGCTAWPKLFQNLRSTRETELAERFPMHVVCEWIGNSQAVAAKHYLQTTDEHYAAATEASEGYLQNPMQSAAEPTRNESSVDKGPAPIAANYGGLPILATSGIHPRGFEPLTFGSVDRCSIQLS